MDIVLVKCGTDDFKYLFEFSASRYVLGFCFSTPNYCTGYYKNPLTALRNFMNFTASRDRKITMSGA